MIELRDTEEARQYLCQGLWLQRVRRPGPPTVPLALGWALEVIASGDPLPPLGFLADLGHVALGLDQEPQTGQEVLELPGVPPGLIRTYEDYVLGKLYADWTFERGADAVRRYQGRDRARGLAYLVNQFRQRAGFGGVLLSPGVVKSLLDWPPDQVLGRGWEGLERGDLHPALPAQYEELTAAVRNAPEVLGPEDLFELEHGTALAQFSQRLALRQVLQAADKLEANLPRHKLRPLARRQQVATRILDEDTYPVGGFSSLSTRGTIESLLHSQLAYMEKQERPDLFDLKFLRDELLYYSRDENQFLRRRRSFLFALYPDLVQARFKDAGLPYQRIVLFLALALAAVRKVIDWLSQDALHFEFLFLETADGKPSPLAAEYELLELLLREQIANGTARLERLPAGKLTARCAERGKRSLCHCVTVAPTDRPLQADQAMVSRLVLNGPRPALGLGDEAPEPWATEDGLYPWAAVLERLLQNWL